MKKLFFYFFIFCAFNLIAKNQYNNWFFGFNSAITFNTNDGNPKSLDSSLIYTLEGSSSISDKNGNLLFYTDGQTIWDKYHKPINLDNLLYGHQSSTQSSIIINLPNSDSIYYIFTADAGEYYNNKDGTTHKHRGFNYSIVEIINDEPKVTKSNIKLLDTVSEKFTATKHFNNNDYWIVVHGFNNNTFYKYLLTSKGLIEIGKQSIGQNIGGKWETTIGFMKFSPDGKYLAYVSEGNDYIEIFKFDNMTGLISEPLIIPTPGRYFNYGIEFSLNSNYIYVSEYKNKTIHRYNLKNYNQNEIKKSEELIIKDSESAYIGAIQIAPDGNIYFARYKSKYLGKILNIDSANVKAILNGVYLGNAVDGFSSYGLPNIVQSYFLFKSFLNDIEICENVDLIIEPNLNYTFNNMKYFWYDENYNLISNSEVLHIENAPKSLQGKFYFKAIYNDNSITDSFFVKINSLPKVEIVGQNELCDSKPIVLKSKYKNENYIYRWNTGETTDSIFVSEAGIYSLTITDTTTNCSNTNYYKIIGEIVDVITEPKNITINSLCINENKSFILCILNNSLKPLNFQKFEFKNNLINQNILIQNYPDKINSKSKFCFDLSFYSDYPKQIIDTLIFYFTNNDCKFELEIPINVRFVIKNQFNLDNYKLSPGENVSISINLSNHCSIKKDVYFNLNADLILKKDIFKLEQLIGAKLNSENYIDDKLIINFSIDSLNLKDDIDIDFKGLSLAGNEKFSYYKIDNIIWNNTDILTDTDTAIIELEYCGIDIRSIKYFRPTKIEINRINEEFVNCKIFLDYQSINTLEIYNINGLLIDKFNFVSDGNNKNYDLLINISQYPSGLYQIILKNHKNIYNSLHFILR